MSLKLIAKRIKCILESHHGVVVVVVAAAVVIVRSA